VDPNGVSCLSGFYIHKLDIDLRSVIINSAEMFLMHHSILNAKVCDNILNNRFHYRKEVNITTHLALQSVRMS
jgi:hypothetical protein